MYICWTLINNCHLETPSQTNEQTPFTYHTLNESGLYVVFTVH